MPLDAAAAKAKAGRMLPHYSTCYSYGLRLRLAYRRVFGPLVDRLGYFWKGLRGV